MGLVERARRGPGAGTSRIAELLAPFESALAGPRSGQAPVAESKVLSERSSHASRRTPGTRHPQPPCIFGTPGTPLAPVAPLAPLAPLAPVAAWHPWQPGTPGTPGTRGIRGSPGTLGTQSRLSFNPPMRVDGVAPEIIAEPDVFDTWIHRSHGQRQERADDAEQFRANRKCEEDGEIG